MVRKGKPIKKDKQSPAQTSGRLVIQRASSNSSAKSIAYDFDEVSALIDVVRKRAFAAAFKDIHLVEFLNLPDSHSEGDLQRSATFGISLWNSAAISRSSVNSVGFRWEVEMSRFLRGLALLPSRAGLPRGFRVEGRAIRAGRPGTTPVLPPRPERPEPA